MTRSEAVLPGSNLPVLSEKILVHLLAASLLSCVVPSVYTAHKYSSVEDDCQNTSPVMKSLSAATGLGTMNSTQ